MFTKGNGVEDCWLSGLGLDGVDTGEHGVKLSMCWMKMVQESLYKSRYETKYDHGAGIASDRYLVPLHMTETLSWL